MDIEKLIEQLRTENLYADLYTLQAENEKLRDELERCREKNAGLALALLTECAPNPDCLGDDEWKAIKAELEQVKRLYESEKEDFLDYACSGIPNFAPYCFNRHPDCVDERGWCKSAECHGFSRNRDQKED